MPPQPPSPSPLPSQQASSSRPSVSSSAVVRPPEPAPVRVSSAVVLYSTQSGRARACANRTARMIRSRRVPVLDGPCPFDEFGADNLLDIGRWRDGGHRRRLRDGDGDVDGAEGEGGGERDGPPLLVMFVSTTGDGEHCDSIRECWTALLHKSLPPDTFRDVPFALFALGDRAYGPAAFCAAGRKLAARLLQLGAVKPPFCPIGYGDDGTPNGGVFADLDSWLEERFLPRLMDARHPPLPVGFVPDDSPRLEPPGYRVTVSGSSGGGRGGDAGGGGGGAEDEEGACMDEFFRSLAPSTAYRYDSCGRRPDGGVGGGSGDDEVRRAREERLTPLLGSVVRNDRITSPDWEQDVRHIRIEVDPATTSAGKNGRDVNGDGDHANGNGNGKSASSLSGSKPYEAGDVAVIMPQNSTESVSTFLSVLPQSIRRLADVPVKIEPAEDPDNGGGSAAGGGATTTTMRWPRKCTLRTLLAECADINGRPEREFLRSLSVFCDTVRHPDGGAHAERLVHLSESAGAALYADYVLREKRTYADVLYDFDSVRCGGGGGDNGDNGGGGDDGDGNAGGPALTLEHLLGLLPPLLPRHFSIASAPSHPDDAEARYIENRGGRGNNGGTAAFAVELCVAVVEGTTPFGRSYEGVCSGYLGRLLPEDSSSSSSPSPPPTFYPPVRMWIRPGSFGRLPLAIEAVQEECRSRRYRFERPVLCVGAGTGIAPLRSILRERWAVMERCIDDAGHAPDGPTTRPTPNTVVVATAGVVDRRREDNILVFGCRKRSADYHYGTEWEEAAAAASSSASSFRLLNAFSRDQRHKIYVQGVARGADGGALIARHILENGGAVYVAGGARMARAVRDEVVESLAEALDASPGGKGEGEAKMLLKRLGRSGLFGLEAWS